MVRTGGSSVRRISIVLAFALLTSGCDREPALARSEIERIDWSGWWASDCADGFGLAIRGGIDGWYGVLFCGPGGCADRRQHATTFVDDPLNRPLSPDLIEVLAREPFLFQRCPEDSRPASARR
jgi:hypothetical protein